MAFLPKVLLLLLLAVVCVQLSGAEVPDRCWCLDHLKKGVRKETIEEFSIFPERPSCNHVEIILTLKPTNNTSKVVQRCLNPHTMQGQNLQSCWKSKNINNTFTFKMSDCPMSQNPKA